MSLDTRPLNCRFRLQDEGKPYPRSGCSACGKRITTGLGKACSVGVAATDTHIAELEAEVERLRKQLAAHLPMADDADESTDDGWIPWEGGECPVKLSAWVEVKFREVPGFPEEQSADSARNFWWRHEGNCGDIIAYRVVQP